MAVPPSSPQNSASAVAQRTTYLNNLSYDENDSIDSNYDIEIPTLTTIGSADALATSAVIASTIRGGGFEGSSNGGVSTTLSSIKYDATTIRKEFYLSPLSRSYLFFGLPPFSIVSPLSHENR